MKRAAEPASRLLSMGLALLVGSSGCVSIDLRGGPPDPLRETVVSGEKGPKILLVKIDGLLSLQAERPDLVTPSPDSTVSRLREVLDKARRDSLVKAIVLRVDSPGGTATASDAMYRELLRFKRERAVPVVAHLIGTAASGAYYLSMAADQVVAQPTTITGSIGVIFVGVSLAGLMEKLGVENQTLTAGAHKDAGSPLRRMSKTERAHLQTVLDELHERFRGVVAAGRPELSPAQVDLLADGRIYTAEQALSLGLVDEVAEMERAVELARTRAGLGEHRVVSYHRPREYENNLYTRGESGAPVLRLALPEPLAWLTRPGFYYVWAPGLQ